MEDNNNLKKLNEKLVEDIEKKDAEIVRLKNQIQHHETLIDRLALFIPMEGM